jgi:WD40 repeat protein
MGLAMAPDGVDRRNAARFAGFISYNREVDAGLARTLQTALHRFAKPWYRLRALRIFRDEASLSASPGLWSSIQRALDDSDHLILLASPQAAASPWVAKEVEYWLQRKSPGRVLIALTSGELVWDPAAGDFDWTRTTSIPPVLRAVFAEEPRYVDLRAARDLSELPRSRVFRELVADLAAPLHHRAKDELIGEDIRLYRRSRGLAFGGVAALALLAVAATLFAVNSTVQAAEARRQRDAATEQQRLSTARALVAQADLARATDPRTALLLGIAAQRIHPDEHTNASLATTVTSTGYAATLPGDGQGVNGLTFSPNGKVLAAASQNEQVVLWDVADPLHARKLGQFEALPYSMGFSTDGKLLAVGGLTVASVWDVSDPARPTQLGEKVRLNGRGSAIGFSPDGRTLATGVSDGTVVFWDLSDRAVLRPVGTPLLHGDEVRSVVYGTDGRSMVTATYGKSVRVWDLTDPANPRPVGQPAVIGRPSIAPIAIGTGLGPGGRLVATTGENQGEALLALLDAAGAAEAPEPIDNGDDEIRQLTFAGDGKLLVASGADRSTAWDLTDPHQPRQLGPPLIGHQAGTGAVAVSTSDGHALVATGGVTGEVILWDLTAPVSAGAAVDVPQPNHAGESSYSIEPVESQAYTPDGRILVTANGAAMVSLWDVTDPDRPRAIGAPLSGANVGRYPVKVAISPDGHTLATAGSDRVLSLWDIRDPANPRGLGAPLAGHSGSSDVAFSPDGRLLATSGQATYSNGNSGAVALYDVSDPANPRLLDPLEQPNEPTSVAFSGDSRTLAAGNADNTVVLWDVTDPSATAIIGAPLAGHTNHIRSVAFSGRQLVSAGSDGTAVLWDLTDLANPVRVGQPLHGPSSGGLVALSGDGRVLLIADHNLGNQMVLWNLTDPAQPHQLGPVLNVPSFAIQSVGIMPDGHRLTIGALDGTLVSWDLRPLFDQRDQPVDYACARTGRGLTAAEWSRYVRTMPYQQTCPL